MSSSSLDLMQFEIYTGKKYLLHSIKNNNPAKEIPVDESWDKSGIFKCFQEFVLQDKSIPSLDQLFRDHFNSVFRLTARLLGPGADRADIEDIVQQVFLTAHRKLHLFRGDSRPSTWLCGIAVRTVMTKRRGFARRRRMLEKLKMAQAKQDPGATEENIAQRQKLEIVWNCLEKMKEKKRMVFLLYEMEGLSGEEIAKLLEIPVSTVWTRLHHARKEIAGSLGRDFCHE